MRHLCTCLRVNQETCKNRGMPRFRQRVVCEADDGWQVIEQQPYSEPEHGDLVPTLDVRDPAAGETYQEFLAAQGIRHFSAREVTLFRRWGKHEEPPRGMWRNIVPALVLGELLRAELGHPLVVGNGWRSEEYNRAVKGSAGSRHRYNQAVDFDLPADRRDLDSRKRFADAAARLWHKYGDALRMGFGVYDDAPSRIHLDCGHRARFWERRHAWPILQRSKT